MSELAEQFARNAEAVGWHVHHRTPPELDDAGVSVLLDDRKASPGVKFADAEILGMPTSVVVGRGLADGVVELRDRATGTSENIDLTDAVARIVAVVHGRPVLD